MNLRHIIVTVNLFSIKSGHTVILRHINGKNIVKLLKDPVNLLFLDKEVMKIIM